MPQHLSSAAVVIGALMVKEPAREFFVLKAHANRQDTDRPAHACKKVQSHQSLCCSATQTVEVVEDYYQI